MSALLRSDTATMQPEKGPPCNLKDRGPSLVANRIDMVLGILARKGYRSVSEVAEDHHVSEMIEVDYRVRETVRAAGD